MRHFLLRVVALTAICEAFHHNNPLMLRSALGRAGRRPNAPFFFRSCIRMMATSSRNENEPGGVFGLQETVSAVVDALNAAFPGGETYGAESALVTPATNPKVSKTCLLIIIDHHCELFHNNHARHKSRLPLLSWE